jgi:hypothetical protein
MKQAFLSRNTGLNASLDRIDRELAQKRARMTRNNIIRKAR